LSARARPARLAADSSKRVCRPARLGSKPERRACGQSAEARVGCKLARLGLLTRAAGFALVS